MLERDRLTFIMSNVCTYLKSMEFKSFNIMFNLSRCRLKSEDAFSQIFIKFSIDRNKLSLDICDDDCTDGFILFGNLKLLLSILALCYSRPNQNKRMYGYI